MKKIFLLPFCLLCVCVGANASETTNSNLNCGANGVSCNDTPLINYTKTEADYRAYGERAKRDHLYTKEATGNNLTATIPPSVEEDVVTAEYELDKPILHNKVNVVANPADDDSFSNVELNIDDSNSIENGAFAGTDSKDLEITKDDFDKNGEIISREEKLATADMPKNEVKRSDTILVSENDGSVYEVVCEEECDDILDDSITSEFTEESFDIADYVDEDGEEIVFTEVGSAKKIATELDIKEVKITDNTILTWEANEGENLRELLTKWSDMSGWKLLWNTNRNYVLSASVMFKGKFADVSSALIRAFARARPAPIATYYKGNRVIVVETMENENAY